MAQQGSEVWKNVTSIQRTFRVVLECWCNITELDWSSFSDNLRVRQSVRSLDDTFTILDRENVDDFLQHLNSQQPSIRFTMETEKDNKLAFLDTAVLREPDGRLTTSVYRKPTHTDQYLAYDSHHPQSVKRGIVKCLYESAKRLVKKPSVISEEKKRLSFVLVSNGYPFYFLQKPRPEN